jgi:SecD/SecF fusion protein
MRNLGIIVFLTVIITLLCVYYLSFTFVSRSVQKDAIAYATDESGSVQFNKKQQYLDSVWNEPVWNLFGIDYTYKDVKDTELSLGLDLQGGMHVTLEISPIDIIRGVSGNSDDPQFLAALDRATEMQRSSQGNFVDLFYQAFKEINPDGNLAPIFATASNIGRISADSPDSEILKIIRQEVEQAIDRSFNILRTRVDRFGTSQPNIQRLAGTGRIQIELPGVENQERVRKLLQGVAKLEFWEVVELYEDEVAGPLSAINATLVEEERLRTSTAPGVAEAVSTDTDSEDIAALLQGEDDAAADTSAVSTRDTTGQTANLDSLANTRISEFFSLINMPQGMVRIQDTSRVNRILDRIEDGDLKSMFPSTIRFLWNVSAIQTETGEEMLPLYAIRTGRGGEAPLTGEVITDARQSYDQRTAPAVSMSMNSVGARKWRRLTADNINSRIAIALDDYVYSAPNVRVEIPNGQSIIEGNFTLEEAQDLANVLKAGALPTKTRIVEEAVIGPTLGREAQKQGITAIIAGFLVVVAFMISYYARGGFIANAALLFNIFFVLGILAQLNAALTLPGIAGIVLTIGMAVDANVLIFERIREEMRNGAKLLAAISLGYKKAYSSIVDANVTTFIIGVLLFTFGQGPVKGFATTLMIGIACSFFTAVFISRVIVTWLTKKGDESNLRFAFPFTRDLLANINWSFMQKRRKAYIGSAIFIVSGLTLLILQGGLNLGVDFTGGRAYVVGFENPVVASDIKTALGGTFEGSGTEVKTYGANNVVKITTSYLVDDESTEADQEVRNTLIQGIEAYSGKEFSQDDSRIDEGHFSILSTSKVGATIADDIKFASLESIVFSLIAIFLYILLRFKKWQFSLGAVVALFHDVLVVIAAFAFARLLGKSFEIDQVIVAALLTVIGYSINDTVVVYDRIRENLLIRPHEKIIDTFNMSINNTMSRTLVTSFTTMIVVLMLLIFGGEVLRGFSFSILIGILVGTYSSVYIASPIVLDLGRKGFGLKTGK